MNPARSLSVVLPAFNESANIEASARSCVQLLDAVGLRGEVIVVDDGSTDHTRAVVEALAAGDARIRLVRHPRNLGYGAALESGFRAARGDLVFFTDADLQFDVAEIPRLLQWADRYDIVAGYRAERRDPWVRRANAWAWGALVNGLFDFDVRDVNCAFKLFHRRVLDRMQIRSDGAFVNTEILAKARSRGFSIKQLPVSHFPRSAGEQTGARPRVIARAFVELARLYTELRPADVHEPTRRQVEPETALSRVGLAS